MSTLGPCSCKKGLERDNCPACEGTGQRIDFAPMLAVARTTQNLLECNEERLRYKIALEAIRREQGVVCSRFGKHHRCIHAACHSSHQSWAIAGEALNPQK